MNTPLYETETRLTLSEYKKFDREVAASVLPSNKALRIIIRALELLLLYFVFWKLITLGKSEAPSVIDIIVYNLWAIAGVIIFIAAYRFIRNRQEEKAYNTNLTVKDKNTYIKFFDDRLETENESGTSTVLYRELYRIIETKTNYYLMTGRNVGYIIIKENCSGELIAFLRETVKKHGLEKPKKR